MLLGRKSLWVVVLLFLAGLALIHYRSGAGRSPADNPPADPGASAVPVTVVKAVRRDFPIYLIGLGKVQAMNAVTLRSQVDGQIKTMAMREGQDVRAGDLLVQIDPRPYEAAVEQARGKRAQDEAQLRNSQKMLQRDRDLVAKGLINQQAFEAQQTETDQLAALARTDDAVVASAEVNLSFTRITSPLNGRVGLRQLDPGNIVRASDGTSLAVITQVQPITVVFTLPDRALSQLADQLQPGTKHAAVLAAERGTDKVLDEGELVAIDNQIDAATGTVRLKAVFKNEHLRLWPGEFVDARLLATTLPRALVVPATALQQGPNGTFVFVAQADQRAEARQVIVASSAHGLAVISRGLEENEAVVVDGQYLLRDKSRIKVAR